MEIISIPQISDTEIDQIIERMVVKTLQEQEILPVEDESLLTTQEVCDMFRVTRITVNNYKIAGRLKPSGKSGKQHVYKKSDCMKVLGHKIREIK